MTQHKYYRFLNKKPLSYTVGAARLPITIKTINCEHPQLHSIHIMPQLLTGMQENGLNQCSFPLKTLLEAMADVTPTHWWTPQFHQRGSAYHNARGAMRTAIIFQLPRAGNWHWVSWLATHCSAQQAYVAVSVTPGLSPVQDTGQDLQRLSELLPVL